MTNNEKTEEQLNVLITMHTDRIKVYENSLEHLDDDPPALELMDKGIELGEKQVKELSELISYSGGTPQAATTITGKLYRAWIELLETFTGPEIPFGLRVCKETDEGLLRAYTGMIDDPTDPELPGDARQLLHDQRTELQSALHPLSAFLHEKAYPDDQSLE